MELPDGRVYEGGYKRDRKHGKGRRRVEASLLSLRTACPPRPPRNGTENLFCFVLSVFKSGTLTWPDGRTYTGVWVDGKEKTKTPANRGDSLEGRGAAHSLLLLRVKAKVSPVCKEGETLAGCVRVSSL